MAALAHLTSRDGGNAKGLQEQSLPVLRGTCTSSTGTSFGRLCNGGHAWISGTSQACFALPRLSDRHGWRECEGIAGAIVAMQSCLSPAFREGGTAAERKLMEISALLFRFRGPLFFASACCAPSLKAWPHPGDARPYTVGLRQSWPAPFEEWPRRAGPAFRQTAADPPNV